MTDAHDAVLALLDWLPADAEPDAELVGEQLLCMPAAEAARLLEELEVVAGCVASATGPVQ